MRKCGVSIDCQSSSGLVPARAERGAQSATRARRRLQKKTRTRGYVPQKRGAHAYEDRAARLCNAAHASVRARRLLLAGWTANQQALGLRSAKSRELTGVINPAEGLEKSIAAARGKMDRFWRTLRERCLNFVGGISSMHDLNVRLLAFFDEHYHRAPHGGLMGNMPETVFNAAPRHPDGFDEKKLRDALTVHARRRVRGDCTIAMDGDDWETDLGFLAHKLVTVSRCMIDPNDPPWIMHENKKHVLRPVDPKANATRPRTKARKDLPPQAQSSFDPNLALLNKSLGRKPKPS
jgi:hypothetical protein